MVTDSVPPDGDDLLDFFSATAGRRESSLDCSTSPGANNNNNTKIHNNNSTMSGAGTNNDAVEQVEKTKYAVPLEYFTTVDNGRSSLESFSSSSSQQGANKNNNGGNNNNNDNVNDNNNDTASGHDDDNNNNNVHPDNASTTSGTSMREDETGHLSIESSVDEPFYDSKMTSSTTGRNSSNSTEMFLFSRSNNTEEDENQNPNRNDNDNDNDNDNNVPTKRHCRRTENTDVLVLQNTNVHIPHVVIPPNRRGISDCTKNNPDNIQHGRSRYERKRQLQQEVMNQLPVLSTTNGDKENHHPHHLTHNNTSNDRSNAKKVPPSRRVLASVSNEKGGFMNSNNDSRVTWDNHQPFPFLLVRFSSSSSSENDTRYNNNNGNYNNNEDNNFNNNYYYYYNKTPSLKNTINKDEIKYKNNIPSATTTTTTINNDNESVFCYKNFRDPSIISSNIDVTVGVDDTSHELDKFHDAIATSTIKEARSSLLVATASSSCIDIHHNHTLATAEQEKNCYRSNFVTQESYSIIGTANITRRWKE